MAVIRSTTPSKPNNIFARKKSAKKKIYNNFYFALHVYRYEKPNVNNRNYDRVPTSTTSQQIESYSLSQLFSWDKLSTKTKTTIKNRKNRIYETIFRRLQFIIVSMKWNKHCQSKNSFLLFSRGLSSTLFVLCVWIFRWGCLQYVRYWHGLPWMGSGYALCGKTEVKSLFIGTDAVANFNDRNKCHKFLKVWKWLFIIHFNWTKFL